MTWMLACLLICLIFILNKSIHFCILNSYFYLWLHHFCCEIYIDFIRLDWVIFAMTKKMENKINSKIIHFILCTEFIRILIWHFRLIEICACLSVSVEMSHKNGDIACKMWIKWWRFVRLVYRSFVRSICSYSSNYITS